MKTIKIIKQCEFNNDITKHTHIVHTHTKDWNCLGCPRTSFFHEVSYPPPKKKTRTNKKNLNIQKKNKKNKPTNKNQTNQKTKNTKPILTYRSIILFFVFGCWLTKPWSSEYQKKLELGGGGGGAFSVCIQSISYTVHTSMIAWIIC